MRILLVGALSWHPERVRVLHERGHELWGTWCRSMAWDQGPYPALNGCLRRIAPEDAAATIRDESIDVVYSLYQSYVPKLWAPPGAGVEEGVWPVLRRLLHERHRGAFDAAIVRHWGFDVLDVDIEVARAMDGHVFCNREKLDYWTAPVDRGGRGLDVLGGCEAVAFMDGDRPMGAFMNDRFAERLSDRDGEIHTVCVGRPFNLDYLALARRGVHVHVYGNAVDDSRRMIARDLPAEEARANAALLDRYLHVHEPLQPPPDAEWSAIRRTKERWVEEFSRYDAGWSYVGNPVEWDPLDDRAAIPNRLGTYLLAGLPVVTDPSPGRYRYDVLRRLGVAIDLADSDYDGLRSRLEAEVRTREKSRAARAARAGYAFDATVDPLLDLLGRARERYLDRPPEVRTRFLGSESAAVVPIGAPLHRRARRSRPARLLRRWIGRTRRLARGIRHPFGGA